MVFAYMISEKGALTISLFFFIRMVQLDIEDIALNRF
jgi:hypothetical protein